MSGCLAPWGPVDIQQSKQTSKLQSHIPHSHDHLDVASRCILRSRNMHFPGDKWCRQYVPLLLVFRKHPCTNALACCTLQGWGMGGWCWLQQPYLGPWGALGAEAMAIQQHGTWLAAEIWLRPARLWFPAAYATAACATLFFFKAQIFLTGPPNVKK